MESYSMFLDGKNQYCENDYTTKCNLQIHCDPYQITNGIFHRTRTKNFTIHVETLVYFIIIIIIFGGGRLEITEMVIPAMKLKEAYC